MARGTAAGPLDPHSNDGRRGCTTSVMQKKRRPEGSGRRVDGERQSPGQSTLEASFPWVTFDDCASSSLRAIVETRSSVPFELSLFSSVFMSSSSCEMSTMELPLPRCRRSCRPWPPTNRAPSIQRLASARAHEHSNHEYFFSWRAHQERQSWWAVRFLHTLCAADGPRFRLVWPIFRMRRPILQTDWNQNCSVECVAGIRVRWSPTSTRRRIRVGIWRRSSIEFASTTFSSATSIVLLSRHSASAALVPSRRSASREPLRKWPMRSSGWASEHADNVARLPRVETDPGHRASGLIAAQRTPMISASAGNGISPRQRQAERRPAGRD